jgi:hypothetical protein
MDVTILAAKGLGTLAIAPRMPASRSKQWRAKLLFCLSERINAAKKGEWQFGYVPHVPPGDIETTRRPY